MIDLKNTFNIYANLSQSTYTGRPRPLPYKSLLQKERKKLDKNQSVLFTFPNAKDAHGNDVSIVYLQPDNTVKTIKEKNWVGREKVYKKGLLT